MSTAAPPDQGTVEPGDRVVVAWGLIAWDRSDRPVEIPPGTVGIVTAVEHCRSMPKGIMRCRIFVDFFGGVRAEYGNDDWRKLVPVVRNWPDWRDAT